MSNFGSLNFFPSPLPPPERRRVTDTFDYEALLEVVIDRWELAGQISERIDVAPQAIGKRLRKLWQDGKIDRAMVGTDIYWRKKCTKS
jgi:DNA-binding transcriptional ArsR family regulator